MDKTVGTHIDTPMRPKAKTMAELLPGIKALLSKETVAMLSSIKQPSSSIQPTWTNVKNIKPMTIAEIRALQDPTPRKPPQPTTSTKSKPWNSSVKVVKTKSLTGDGKMKHSTARKGLDFQAKPKPAANIGATVVSAVARKSMHPQAKASGSSTSIISGVCRMPETPVVCKSKQTFILPYRMAKNISFESNGDDSFIQKEKEINEFESKCNALTEDTALEKIAEISPPTSTPFKDHRNFRVTFDHSETENSDLWNDNTIMVFEKTSENKDTKRKESPVESICEMLNIATVPNLTLKYLCDVQRQIDKNVKMADNYIQMVNCVKETQLEAGQFIGKLIDEIRRTSETTGDYNTVKPIIEPENVSTRIKEEKFSTENSPGESRPTVIKSKSPSYKIPRKSLCLRKKILHKSVPNISDNIKTPNKNSEEALNMYMQMKEHISFLNTPWKKRQEAPDTPARISHNLQNQLDKLYN